MREGAEARVFLCHHEITSTEWKIERNLAKIAKLEKPIVKREDSKEEALATIEVTEKEIVEMEDRRKKEHAALLAAKRAPAEYHTDSQIKIGKGHESIKAALV